jgi:hypothetical protein
MNNDQRAFLQELADFLDGRADVAAGCPDGTTPNEEMRLLKALHHAFPTLDGANRKLTKSLAWYPEHVAADGHASGGYIADTPHGRYKVLRKGKHGRAWVLWLDEEALCEAPDASTARTWGNRHAEGTWKP